MYIDKIYTKLYSNKDWNGLKQLVNEIKSFAMTERDKQALNAKLRLAKEGKLKKTDWMSRHGYTPTNSNRGILEMADAAKEGDFNKFNSKKDNLDLLYEPGAYARSQVNGDKIGDGSYKDFIIDQINRKREKIRQENEKRKAEIDRKTREQKAMNNFEFI